jgi:hypothetical protein
MVDIVKNQNVFTLTAYYKQILYLTCLRTNPDDCTNPACNTPELDVARSIPGCSDDGDYAGDFERSVFEAVLGNPDFANLPEKTIETEELSWGLGAVLSIFPPSWGLGVNDPRTIGAVYVGTQHFIDHVSFVLSRN